MKTKRDVPSLISVLWTYFLPSFIHSSLLFPVCFSYHSFVYTPISFASPSFHSLSLSFICSFSFVLSIIFFLPHKLYPAFCHTNCVVKHLCCVFRGPSPSGPVCVRVRVWCVVLSALLCMLVRRGSLCVLVFESFLFKMPDNGLVIEENSRLTMSLCVW